MKANSIIKINGLIISPQQITHCTLVGKTLRIYQPENSNPLVADCKTEKEAVSYFELLNYLFSAKAIKKVKGGING